MVPGDKRHLGHEPPGASSTELVVAAKKPRCDGALVSAPGGGGTLSVPGGSVPRTSDLAAPIMQLSGHAGEVLTARFSPCGAFLATAGFDKELLLWQTFGDCRNYCTLRAHGKAVLQLAWGVDSTLLYSAGADKTLVAWDAEYGERVARLTGHTSHVNSVAAARGARGMIASGSDDCSCRVWDARVRSCVQRVGTRFQTLAVELSADGGRLFAGGLDNVVRVFDLRRADNVESAVIALAGHADSITGLRLSPDGAHILSTAMDSTVRSWDVRPFVPAGADGSDGRGVRVYAGAVHNFEKNLIRCAWAPDGARVASGSADRCVYVWDVPSSRMLYKLPGHKGSVNEVDFHPTQPIIASCSSDKTVYLGEIEAS
ncbi:hypothetical protein KFE25_004146 [Diacronema lutheri]|uniref:Uncharacterized protein n=1 Tax=Diacronema lutheri TaxID=2081491 RepID=A0A8J5X9C3_DIALT|nr:hypothetical protein KFE25_004146 [Diacronema lutheri]